jgi:hypothetical protein
MSVMVEMLGVKGFAMRKDFVGGFCFIVDPFLLVTALVPLGFTDGNGTAGFGFGRNVGFTLGASDFSIISGIQDRMGRTQMCRII